MPTVTDNTLDALLTPERQRGQMVTNSIRQLTQQMTDTNDEDEPTPKRSRYLKFTPEQLSQLIVACSTTGTLPHNIQQSSPTSVLPSNAHTPSYVANAKYEEICCKAIKPTYDGTEADLMPFLLRLDIRRQDEGWVPATYIEVEDNTFDLTTDFAHITEQQVVQVVSSRWKAPTVDLDKHTVGHETYQARLLAKCLLASISSDLALTLINRIPNTYRNDGTYLLWALSNNIYRNNIAFMESIREKIVDTTVIQHQNDVEKYLIFIKNHLRMITSKSTSTKRFNGLITYILRQLKTTQNQIFLRYIQDLHVAYQEGQLPKYTPLKLISDVEDKIRVLRHTEVWDSTTNTDTPAMALQAAPTFSDQLKDFLANHIAAEVKRLIPSSKQNPAGKDTKDNKDGKSKFRQPHPEWLFIAPQNLEERKTVQNRTYNWCTKCNRGSGQWVITHTDDTHRADYIHPNKRQDGSRRPPAQPVANAAQLATPSPATNDAATTQPGQLSLSEGITNAFRFDVQEYHDDDWAVLPATRCFMALTLCLVST